MMMFKKFFSFTCMLVLMLSLLLSSCQNATTVKAFEYESKYISANMYSYWLSSYKKDFLNSYNNGVDSKEFWDSTAPDGRTYEEYLMDIARQNIQIILICTSIFDREGLKVDDAIIRQIDADIDEKIDYYGGVNVLNEELSTYGINEKILKEIYLTEEKVKAVYDYYYTQDQITDEMRESYYKENYVRVKQLYLAPTVSYDSTDADGNMITVELSAEKRNEMIQELKQLIDLTKTGAIHFEEILDDYSQYNADPVAENYENGYYFTKSDSAQYGNEFVNQSFALNVDEVTCYEDANGGFHVIQRCELLDQGYKNTPDAVWFDKLDSYVISRDFSQKIASQLENVILNEEVLNSYSLKNVALLPYSF